MDRSVAMLRYAQHKVNAKQRGIEFEFTFDEWCEIWEPHWSERGQRKGGRVMCRTHDKGAYRNDNVRIDSPKGNSAEAALMRRCAKPQWHASIGPREWSGFKSYGSNFARPDRALEDQQKEYEWIPGE